VSPSRRGPGPSPQAGARAGVGPDADGGVQPRGVGGVELVGQEGGRLEGLVPLRRQIIEADAVVEREPSGGLPVVLDVELEVVVDPLRHHVLRGLPVVVEHPDRRVRVAKPRVVGVAGVVDEVDPAVVAGEGALGLVAVLVVDAELGGMGPPDLGQVGEGVVGRVLVPEWGPVGPDVARARADPSPAEVQPRDVVLLDGLRVEERERSQAHGRAPQVRVLGAGLDLVVRAPDTDLDRRRGSRMPVAETIQFLPGMSVTHWTVSRLLLGMRGPP